MTMWMTIDVLKTKTYTRRGLVYYITCDRIKPIYHAIQFEFEEGNAAEEGGTSLLKTR